jgi:hypothetical protein
MSIMATRHGHKGTYGVINPTHVSFEAHQPKRENGVKMYKSRPTKLGLDKNNWANDVVFILGKKTERDAIKKQYAIHVRD